MEEVHDEQVQFTSYKQFCDDQQIEKTVDMDILWICLPNIPILCERNDSAQQSNFSRANVDWYETLYVTSGAELDPVLTKAAMQEEMNLM